MANPQSHYEASVGVPGKAAQPANVKRHVCVMRLQPSQSRYEAYMVKRTCVVGETFGDTPGMDYGHITETR